MNARQLKYYRHAIRMWLTGIQVYQQALALNGNAAPPYDMRAIQRFYRAAYNLREQADA